MCVAHAPRISNLGPITWLAFEHGLADAASGYQALNRQQGSLARAHMVRVRRAVVRLQAAIIVLCARPLISKGDVSAR